MRALACGVMIAANAWAQAPDSFQISVNVDLVVLQATVSGRGGSFPADLAQGDFTVYEDGVKQSIKLFRHEDAPVTVGLVIDHSGSMLPKLPEVVAAARSFVQSSNPHDEMFVVNFNDRVTIARGSPRPSWRTVWSAPSLAFRPPE